ncbi:hypothetical protein Tco_0000198 [Tanacetum coccineum]
MLTDEIKQSEAYQAFIAYSTCLIPPKKTGGKGSQGKKQTITQKKKSSISAEENIILEADVALELGMSISKTKVEIAEEERHLHETHERLVIAKPTGVDESDHTSNVSKKKSLDRTQKIKGIQVMFVEEQLAADTKKAIKASKEAFRLQQQTADSSKRACITPEVPDELTGKFTTSSEGVGIIPGVLDEGKGSSASKADAGIDWGSKDDSHQSDDEHVNKETDDERIDLKNDDQAMIDADKIVAKKLEEEKGDEEEEQANEEKPEAPPSSSIRSLSSNYCNQFLNVYSDTSLAGIIKDHADTEINSLLDVQIQLEIPPILSAPLLDVLVSVNPPQTTTTTPTPLRTPPITIDHSTVISESIRSQVPPAVNEFLGSILGDSLQKVLQKHTEELKQQESQKHVSEIIKIKQEHVAKQKWPKHSITPFDNTALYDALIQSLFMDEDDMDKAAAIADQSTQENRKHDDQDKDHTAGSDQGMEKKMPRKDTQPLNKSSKTKESSKDKLCLKHLSLTGNDDEDPNGEATPKTNNASKNNWFKQPPRPPTSDLEWNKCQVIDDQPEQTWFNDLVSAVKDSLTFDELTATPIDFSKFEKNRLKLDKITKAELVGPVYNLLKGTCQSSIELEYNMEECYKALFDQLDWTNPEGDRCPFDLSKSLPLKAHPGHLTIASEYFFNNDLEYLKSTNTERKYTTSIAKTKFSKHDIYSPLKILSVVSVKVNKLQGYGYLEEIVDMLLLVIQHKLFHLDGDVIVDLAVALRMFTRSLIIKKRVKDVQLGVESYLNKLNITKPQKDFPTISAKEPYTPSFDPPRVMIITFLGVIIYRIVV